ncbi:MAG TPA: rhodanese-like domain-containing protein [Pyrinomonadaceae bacterium]|jgi:3-mercaptopyruvate sulfurtransferase SseA|nr:rhodanese-like domain-containing protein [Pyrinomonadaceae bacterium]
MKTTLSRLYLILAAACLTLFVAAEVACRQGGGKDPFASIPRMSVEELKKALKEGRAVVLDVRPAEAFEAEHIAGAVSIPEEEVKERAGELPKDKLVVAYCT